MTVEPLRIVLGEADTSASPLRFVLEGEGFHLVGMAGGDDDLPRVLAGARPSAIVLDAGISAPAALEVRERHPDVPLVLVWPPGVVAVLAADRVDPQKVITDLGPTVRRAAARAAARVAARRALDVTPVDARPPLVGIVRTPAAPRPPRPRPAPRGRQVSRPTAFIASVALLYVLVGASVAFGLPYALHHVLRRPAAPHGSPSQVATQSLGAGVPAVSVAPRATVGRLAAPPNERTVRTGGAGHGRPQTPAHRPDRSHASERGYPPRPGHPATPPHASRPGHPSHPDHPRRPAASQRDERGTGA